MNNFATIGLKRAGKAMLGTMALALLAFVIAPAPAYAGGLSPEERAIIRGFYNWAEDETGHQHSGARQDYDRYDDDHGGKKAGKGAKGTPPGLAKKGGMAPGHRKQIERGKGLPPGLAGRDLPDDLHSRLPRRTDAYYRIIDSDVVLIERGTELVLDILTDVVRNQ